MTLTHIPGVGDVLGGCRLERMTARGGMGVVYEATQLALGRRVAVKVISPQLADDPEFRERFVREAQVAASVHHPNIVDVYDAGEQDGVLYLVMRFVDGVDLRTVLRAEHRLHPERAVRIVTDVAGALDAAHRAGLIHRDVTPSNILLSGDGADERAALTDFGLVKHVDTQGATRTGTWFGTLAFVAPEALRDDPVDGRSDVYALGCLLHRMLTGSVPFARDSDAATITAHLHDAPPRPSEASGVDPAFDAVITRALAKEPSDRFATAGALALAAQAALHGERLDPGAAQTSIARDPDQALTRVAAPAQDATRRVPGPAGSDPGRDGATRVAPSFRAPTPRARPAPAAARPPRRTGAFAAVAVFAALVGGAIAIGVNQAVNPPTPTRPHRALPKTPVRPALTSYQTPAYRAQVPRSWKTVADDVDRGGYRESRWRAPYPGHAELAIVYRTGSGVPPDRVATAARGRMAVDPTYSEVAFGPISLNGDIAQRWVYGVDGQARANWYLNPCGTSIAVYAGSRPSEFLRWAPTFRAVTASVQPTCS
ncbi:MAG TPA: serine/threonine-protein kinase [Solirubrobacteraceae bacterium]